MNLGQSLGGRVFLKVGGGLKWTARRPRENLSKKVLPHETYRKVTSAVDCMRHSRLATPTRIEAGFDGQRCMCMQRGCRTGPGICAGWCLTRFLPPGPSSVPPPAKPPPPPPGPGPVLQKPFGVLREQRGSHKTLTILRKRCCCLSVVLVLPVSAQRPTPTLTYPPAPPPHIFPQGTLGSLLGNANAVGRTT